MNCSLPGSSAHGIFQARILEWVAMPSSRGSSWPTSPVAPALQADSLPSEPQRKTYSISLLFCTTGVIILILPRGNWHLETLCGSPKFSGLARGWALTSDWLDFKAGSLNYHGAWSLDIHLSVNLNCAKYPLKNHIAFSFGMGSAVLRPSRRFCKIPWSVVTPLVLLFYSCIVCIDLTSWWQWGLGTHIGVCYPHLGWCGALPSGRFSERPLLKLGLLKWCWQPPLRSLISSRALMTDLCFTLSNSDHWERIHHWQDISCGF